MYDSINQLHSWLGRATIGVEISLSLEETFMVEWIGECKPLSESRDDIFVSKNFFVCVVVFQLKVADTCSNMHHVLLSAPLFLYYESVAQKKNKQEDGGHLWLKISDPRSLSG